MSASQYTYITSPYHLVVFPNGPFRDPDWNHYRIISTLLSLAPNYLYSPIGTKIAKFIHRNHQFKARLYLDPIDLIVVIDINPVNSSPTPFFDLPAPSRHKFPPTTYIGTSFPVQSPLTYTWQSLTTASSMISCLELYLRTLKLGSLSSSSPRTI